MIEAKKLKLAILHNYYQYPGGEDNSTEAEIQFLLKAGHKVEFIKEHNNQIEDLSNLEKLKLFFTTAWNPQQAKTLKSQLKTLRPDILHVQNFFPLFSPSVHKAAQSLNIPTVQHLRNFRLGCLNGYLYRNETTCEACVGKNSWRGVVHRCYRNSLPASLSVWNMLTYNRWRKTWEEDVDAFITPSQFAAKKLIEIGIPSDRLHVKPNVTPDPLINQEIPPLPRKPTFLYFGRLSAEKGIMTILKAWQVLNQPEWQLNIIGDGAERNFLELFVQESGMNNVNFTGYLPTEKILNAIKESTIILVPSQWYEIFGRVVIEAFACGRGVLASNLGALPELVQDSKNGFLVTANNVEEWREKIEWVGHNPLAIAQIGKQARQTYLEKYTPEINYKQLLEIYHTIL